MCIRDRVSTQSTGSRMAQVSDYKERWYWMDDDKIWKEYNQEDSDLLEGLLRSGGTKVTLFNDQYEVDYDARTQKKLDTGQIREIRRGAWFYKDLGGRLVPCKESISKQLEEAFRRGQFSSRIDHENALHSIIYSEGTGQIHGISGSTLALQRGHNPINSITTTLPVIKQAGFLHLKIRRSRRPKLRWVTVNNSALTVLSAKTKSGIPKFVLMMTSISGANLGGTGTKHYYNGTGFVIYAVPRKLSVKAGTREEATAWVKTINDIKRPPPAPTTEVKTTIVRTEVTPSSNTVTVPTTGVPVVTGVPVTTGAPVATGVPVTTGVPNVTPPGYPPGFVPPQTTFVTGNNVSDAVTTSSSNPFIGSARTTNTNPFLNNDTPSYSSPTITGFQPAQPGYHTVNPQVPNQSSVPYNTTTTSSPGPSYHNNSPHQTNAPYNTTTISSPGPSYHNNSPHQTNAPYNTTTISSPGPSYHNNSPHQTNAYTQTSVAPGIYQPPLNPGQTPQSPVVYHQHSGHQGSQNPGQPPQSPIVYHQHSGHQYQVHQNSGQQAPQSPIVQHNVTTQPSQYSATTQIPGQYSTQIQGQLPQSPVVYRQHSGHQYQVNQHNVTTQPSQYSATTQISGQPMVDFTTPQNGAQFNYNSGEHPPIYHQGQISGQSPHSTQIPGQYSTQIQGQLPQSPVVYRQHSGHQYQVQPPQSPIAHHQHPGHQGQYSTQIQGQPPQSPVVYHQHSGNQYQVNQNLPPVGHGQNVGQPENFSKPVEHN
eukprot:TRINITY_DN2780_c0_g1_i1.p1 TRINITY_DN2780_c0_g1~~TRINITY_DN2780_c0_g1_i1.p1  ORF type:complete len:759 (-),score=162.14 TRINITY_DN2780_c0_g1_i1:45-2321(-)